MADILFWKSSSLAVQGYAAGRSAVLSVESDSPKNIMLLTLVSRLTVGVNVAIVALIASSSIPQIFQIVLTIPGVALGSIMACNVHRNLLSEGRQGIEEEPGTAQSLGLSFTDITSFFTRSYRSEGSTDNPGHVGAQNDIPEVKTLPTEDLDSAV